MSIIINNTIYNYLNVPEDDTKTHQVAFSYAIETTTPNNPITQLIAYVDNYSPTGTDMVIGFRLIYDNGAKSPLFGSDRTSYPEQTVDCRGGFASVDVRSADRVDSIAVVAKNGVRSVVGDQIGQGNLHAQGVGSGVLVGVHGTWTTIYPNGAGSRPELVSLAWVFRV
ncbi:hypothetical protein BJY00DRAFT_308857 [Aspergillus carlsbadensis]|nr:hypothetical protein BJY00DRAFT_308857 [Aspergillus carlsbadensis]